MHAVPLINLSLRCTGDTEDIGIDAEEMNEFAYDYVEHEKELLPGSTSPLHQGPRRNMTENSSL